MVSPIETDPRWIGEVLQRSLPAGVEVRASYYSTDEDARILKALVVCSSSLFAFRLALGPVGKNVVDKLTLTVVSLGRVESVSVSGTVWFGERLGDDRTDEVVVQLETELPPFGKVITLPIEDDDYGMKNLSQAAARKFGDALGALLGTSPPAAPR